MSTTEVATSGPTLPRGDVLTSNQPDTIKDPRISSGLPGTGTRLDGFVPTPPHKRAKKSFIWQNGVGLAVTNIKTGKKFWLCRHCYDNPVLSRYEVL